MLKEPNFNLWSEPWLGVERADGTVEDVSIATALADAPTLRGIYDSSPLVTVAVQRLLTAILQDALQPRSKQDLIRLWRAGRFPADKLTAFAAQFADRFDIFSAEKPFLQSAEFSLTPIKGDKVKPIGYILEDRPAGSAVTHYRHAYDAQQQFCASCAAKGLISLPAFASSGGAGIKPSINGVPPIYVIPGGDTLFDQLAASLLTPTFYPPTAANQDGIPWWRRENNEIGFKREVLAVGYLHGLTFPARQVRLHPKRLHQPCSRCGNSAEWGVATLIFNMGESRPKTAALWQDPFAAYRAPKGDAQPLPIRPVEGRAVWREFGNIFMPVEQQYGLRPRVISQLSLIEEHLPDPLAIPFKTVGLRTDMKMKIFEWEESDFKLAYSLVDNIDAAQAVETVLEFARVCDQTIKRVFKEHFGGDKSAEINIPIKQRLSQSYWDQLADPFRNFITQLAVDEQPLRLAQTWALDVMHDAEAVFTAALERLPAQGKTLRQRVEAERHCANALQKAFDKQFPQGDNNEQK